MASATKFPVPVSVLCPVKLSVPSAGESAVLSEVLSEASSESLSEKVPSAEVSEDSVIVILPS